MSTPRFLLKTLLKMGVAAACLAGAIAACRLLLAPLIASAFSLDMHASSIVRRVILFAAAVLSYWVFVRYCERRDARELSLRCRWILPAAPAGALSIGVTILALYATGHYEMVSSRGFAQAAGVFGTIWIAAVLEEVAFTEAGVGAHKKALDDLLQS
jgi:hypothetical protein